MPERIQLRRTKGWRKPPEAVVVTRSTRWGNPWTLVPPGGFYTEHFHDWHDHLTDKPGPWRVAKPLWGLDPEEFATKAEAAAQAVARYEEHVLAESNRSNVMHPSPELIRQFLVGVDLACWCRLEDPCHADALLRIANVG